MFQEKSETHSWGKRGGEGGGGLKEVYCGICASRVRDSVEHLKILLTEIYNL